MESGMSPKVEWNLLTCYQSDSQSRSPLLFSEENCTNDWKRDKSLEKWSGWNLFSECFKWKCMNYFWRQMLWDHPVSRDYNTRCGFEACGCVEEQLYCTYNNILAQLLNLLEQGLPRTLCFLYNAKLCFLYNATALEKEEGWRSLNVNFGFYRIGSSKMH